MCRFKAVDAVLREDISFEVENKFKDFSLKINRLGDLFLINFKHFNGVRVLTKYYPSKKYFYSLKDRVVAKLIREIIGGVK